MASLFLGALFFGFGTYSFLAEESLVNSFIVIGLIFAFFVNCRLGLSHRVTDKPDL